MKFNYVDLDKQTNYERVQRIEIFNLSSFG
jgi:hypothetical protein